MSELGDPGVAAASVIFGDVPAMSQAVDNLQEEQKEKREAADEESKDGEEEKGAKEGEEGKGTKEGEKEIIPDEDDPFELISRSEAQPEPEDEKSTDAKPAANTGAKLVSKKGLDPVVNPAVNPVANPGFSPGFTPQVFHFDQKTSKSKIHKYQGAPPKDQ